jgi:hypothetical protein
MTSASRKNRYRPRRDRPRAVIDAMIDDAARPPVAVSEYD